MKNADMPAMPIIDDEQSFPIDGENYGKSLSSGRFAVGMTKREMMAMHAMTGLLSGGKQYDNRYSSRASQLVEDSVLYADALLAELERTK